MDDGGLGKQSRTNNCRPFFFKSALLLFQFAGYAGAEEVTVIPILRVVDHVSSASHMLAPPAGETNPQIEAVAQKIPRLRAQSIQVFVKVTLGVLAQNVRQRWTEYLVQRLKCTLRPAVRKLAEEVVVWQQFVHSYSILPQTM